ncbi:MAG TPA: cupin domain-containing protein [Chryseolinea sp.]|nr:cupin domain-containing protein [Chryseolinea sp.]HPH46290.1 cupin domain-containing protein [Chryseolinea sp.]HPM30861.1 cupin domain-containing protein [Chryseolinea sp.]
MNSTTLIQKLQLQPHPEGGFYRETYRSNQSMLSNEEQNRNVSTSIYYLLENKDKSHFHRIKSDELWYFHQGKTLEIVSIQNNNLVTILLGNDLSKGEVPQAMIPANVWFAARVKNEIGFSLVSCSVAPGFDFKDFEMAKRQDLIQLFPDQRDVIENFTKE